VFVRAVWRDKRLIDEKRTLRVFDVPTSKNAGIIGVCAPDFGKMTRGLFDRQP